MPLTSLHFEVSWGDSLNTAAFSEVSGLVAEAEVIEYRTGDDTSLTVEKIPGLKKFGNVTMKRGVAGANGNGMFEWYDSIISGDVDRRPVTVSLLNENRDIAMSWEMADAWPVKLEGASLNATGNEIAIETVEFAHTGLRVSLGAGA